MLTCPLLDLSWWASPSELRQLAVFTLHHSHSNQWRHRHGLAYHICTEAHYDKTVLIHCRPLQAMLWRVCGHLPLQRSCLQCSLLTSLSCCYAVHAYSCIICIWLMLCTWPAVCITVQLHCITFALESKCGKSMINQKHKNIVLVMQTRHL